MLFADQSIINIQTPALLFPALSLLMLAYTNRFLGLAKVIRDLKATHERTGHESLLRQIDTLLLRIRLIKIMQAAGVLAIFFCVLAMACMFWDLDKGGEWCFGASLIVLCCSLLFAFWEILISGGALRIELESLRRKNERLK
ncbi:MAG: DUF2721 domain-containing protein [Pirellulales bacterium]